MKDMHQALIDAATKTALLVLPEPMPFVLQTSLDDFYVSYQINAYVKEPNKQALIYSNLHQNIQDVCNERGIEIMSPHYRAARDGNKTTIPETYLDKEYQAPAFSVNLNKSNSLRLFFFMPLIVYICLQFILNGADKIQIVIWRRQFSNKKLIPKLEFYQ
jgi:hypothetical protein